MAIRFYGEDVEKPKFRIRIIRDWIKEEIIRKQNVPGDINIIFTSDNYLREINKKYLSRDYFTDIISFDYSDQEILSGDLFISIDRIVENAVIFGQSFENELYRVMIHGILHLSGFVDDTGESKKLMRNEENKCIKNLLNKINK